MLLIVIEGIDGAGTTTQARRLADTLRAENLAVHLTREPSDGPVGRLLRDMLAGKHAPVDATTLALLFAADRADHLQREVEPHLAAGTIVVSDRWYHSSLAYQGTTEDRQWISLLNQRARVPDLTIFLEVTPEVAAQRRADASRQDELFDDIATQRRVAAGYQDVIAALCPGERIEIVDGERSTAEIATRITELARQLARARDKRQA
jgi:dTMP kinase